MLHPVGDQIQLDQGRVAITVLFDLDDRRHPLPQKRAPSVEELQEVVEHLLATGKPSAGPVEIGTTHRLVRHARAPFLRQ